MLVRIYFIIPTVAYNVLLYFLHSCWDFTWDIYVQNSTAEKMGREKEQMWSHMEQGVTRRLPSTVQAGRTVFSRTHICVLVLRTLSTRATRKERMENLPAPHPPLPHYYCFSFHLALISHFRAGPHELLSCAGTKRLKRMCKERGIYFGSW